MTPQPMPLPTAAAEVLDFWFLPADDPDHGKAREVWFRKDPAFDQLIRERFEPLLGALERGELSAWGDSPRARLARILIADQFTRNTRRDDPRAFALDPIALAETRALVASGADRDLKPAERSFAYLPFEHAESLADQDEAIRLYNALAQDAPEWNESLVWAVKHRDVIVRFGRFPHRNEILGRASTPEELAFLAQPGSRF